MSREIKFRAWDTHFHCYEQIDLLFSIRKGSPKRWLLEQYTGFTDRNGKEIYEEDLLRCKGAYGDDFYFKVVWAGDGWFLLKYRTDNLTINLNDDSARLGYWFDREVIGNVHENPELLENNK